MGEATVRLVTRAGARQEKPTWLSRPRFSIAEAAAFVILVPIVQAVLDRWVFS
jgi:hypothetical protein